MGKAAKVPINVEVRDWTGRGLLFWSRGLHGVGEVFLAPFFGFEFPWLGIMRSSEALEMGRKQCPRGLYRLLPRNPGIQRTK